MKMVTLSEKEQIDLGVKIGKQLLGGELIELTGDVGAGKTTLTKGIALGMGIVDEVQSPSFTISRVYKNSKNLFLYHYDFYRLNDPGLMSEDLSEAVNDTQGVVVIEWSDVVKNVLPSKRLSIKINHTNAGRDIIIDGLNNYPYISKDRL